jgi:hypothetical protein
MALDFRAHMFGGNKRKVNNQPVIEAVLQGSWACLSCSLQRIWREFQFL